MLSNPRLRWAEIQWLWRRSDGALKCISALQVEREQDERHIHRVGNGSPRGILGKKTRSSALFARTFRPATMPISLILSSHFTIAFLLTFSFCFPDTCVINCALRAWWCVRKLLLHHQRWSSLNAFASLSAFHMIIRAFQRADLKESRQEKICLISPRQQSASLCSRVHICCTVVSVCVCVRERKTEPLSLSSEPRVTVAGKSCPCPFCHFHSQCYIETCHYSLLTMCWRPGEKWIISRPPSATGDRQELHFSVWNKLLHTVCRKARQLVCSPNTQIS